MATLRLKSLHPEPLIASDGHPYIQLTGLGEDGAVYVYTPNLFPGLLKWQEEVKHRAAEDKILVSKFGAIRRFYDVERFSRKDQKFIGGDQAEAAIAFLPAANAFGDIRDMMITLDDQKWTPISMEIESTEDRAAAAGIKVVN